MLDLPAILKQAEAASEAPWTAGGPTPRSPWFVTGTQSRDIAEIVGHPGQDEEADAEFIAAARANVPLLVAALQEAQGKLAAFREAATLGPDVPASEILAILGESA